LSRRTAAAKSKKVANPTCRDIPNAINDGETFRLWVTDGPRGQGNRVFALTVAAENG
jgi:hypothetical protein